MDNRPIGIFDSGLGGLTVWKEIRTRLPKESLIYLGDGKNCPYGRQPKEKIRAYAEQAVESLLLADAKAIVVACNTATAAAIDHLRSKYPLIPFVGMEPAIKTAALSTDKGVVGVLATLASFEGNLYRNTSSVYASDVRVVEAEGTGFVELVENDMEQSQEALSEVSRVMRPLIDAGIDKLVLGCTHYPFLTDAIRAVTAQRGIEIVRSAPAVARRTAALLEERSLLASQDNTPYYRFMTFAGEDYLRRLERKSQRALEMDF